MSNRSDATRTTNDTPAHENDRAIECTKVRKCGWKGMESDLVAGAPVKWMRGATSKVCPQCGNDTYYTREIHRQAAQGEKHAG